MKKFLVFVLASLATGFCRADAAADLHAILNQRNSLTASFEQRQYSETGELIEISEGDVAIQKPNQVRWHVASPFEQLIVSNGVWLWQYDVELEQAVRRPAPEKVSATPLMVLSEPLETLRQYYEVEQKDARCFALKALDNQSMFVNMTLCFNAANILQTMRLTDGFGQRTDVELINVDNDLPVDPLSFEFTPPEDVEVVIEDGHVSGV